MNSNITYFVNNLVSFETWLDLILSTDSKIFPNNCFPSNEILEEYLTTIHNRTDKEIKDLLRKFLVHTGHSVEKVKLTLEMASALEQNNDSHSINMLQRLKSTEYYRRALSGEPAFEGITWILDLIPRFPKVAIESIQAYLLSNFGTLPDYSIDGLYDAMAIIRARFINKQYLKDTYYSLTDMEFELLVQALYKEMGYKANLTRRSVEMGIDIIAEKHSTGEKETLFV